MTDTTRSRQRQMMLHAPSKRRTLWLFAAVVVMASLPYTLSYNIDIPKVARSHGLSRTRLSVAKKDVAHEETYALRRPPKTRTSASKVAMTSVAINHTNITPTFERRMRDMVLSNEKKTKQRTSNLPNNVKLVTSLQEYKQVVGEETEKLVVARFYAPWCQVGA